MKTMLGCVAAASACCGTALADLQYGDGTIKPRSDRWTYAHAATLGMPGEQEFRTTDNQAFEAQSTAESRDDFGSYAYALAYERSTMDADALRFSMRAQSSREGPFASLQNGAMIDAWIHADRETAFAFFSPEVFYYINTVILREDETVVPVEFRRVGDLSVATGALSEGWYHVQLNVGGRFTQSDGEMYGWIGVPAPGAAPIGLVALGLIARRRRTS